MQAGHRLDAGRTSSVAFTLFILFETWIMPLEGWLIDRMGPRIFLTIAGLLCGIGWSSLAYVTSLPQLYAVLLRSAGVGAAFVYSGSIGIGAQVVSGQARPGLRASSRPASAAGSALFIPVIALPDRHAELPAGVLVRPASCRGIVIIVAAQFLRHPSHRAGAAAKVAAAGAQSENPSEHGSVHDGRDAAHAAFLHAVRHVRDDGRPAGCW